MKRAAIAIAVVAALVAGCASTEVLEYRSAPGQEVLTGKGGAVKVVDGMEVWIDGGSPPRDFRIIAQSTTDYRTGALDGAARRDNALAQIVAEAKKRGADAVIVYGEAASSGGAVYIPGATTTTGSYYAGRYNATTTPTPGVMAPTGARPVGAFFIKYQ